MGLRESRRAQEMIYGVVHPFNQTSLRSVLEFYFVTKNTPKIWDGFTRPRTFTHYHNPELASQMSKTRVGLPSQLFPMNLSNEASNSQRVSSSTQHCWLNLTHRGECNLSRWEGEKVVSHEWGWNVGCTGSWVRWVRRWVRNWVRVKSKLRALAGGWGSGGGWGGGCSWVEAVGQPCPGVAWL